MNDLVSIVIPAYNAELYVLKAVESILNQTYKNIEVIITDDCSSDKTYQILQSINDERIKLFRNEKNSGVSATLNHCILQSAGDLIGVMHADDIAYDDRIKLQASFLHAHNNITVVGSQCDSIDEGDNFLRVYPVKTDTEELLLETLLKNIPFPHPSVMYKKEAVLDVGLYNSKYDGLEDHDMWLRLAAAGYKFGNLPDTLLKYRNHTNQISQNFTESDYVKNFSIFYDFVQSLGLQRSYEETANYCRICMNSYITNSSQEFKFFLSFFMELLNNQKNLTTPEKQVIKAKLIKRILTNRSKKSIRFYIDFLSLFKWVYLN